MVVRDSLMTEVISFTVIDCNDSVDTEAMGESNEGPAAIRVNIAPRIGTAIPREAANEIKERIISGATAASAPSGIVDGSTAEAKAICIMKTSITIVDKPRPRR